MLTLTLTEADTDIKTPKIQWQEVVSNSLRHIQYYPSPRVVKFTLLTKQTTILNCLHGALKIYHLATRKNVLARLGVNSGEDRSSPKG